MELLYICMYQFYEDETGLYSISSFGNDFWKKYLAVFDSIHIVGEPLKGYLDKTKLAKIDTSRISFEFLPSNNSPQDWKNDKIIMRRLDCLIQQSNSILIKPASRKGVMAIKIAKKYDKPYLIEMTGDLHSALKHHTNPLKRIYAPIIYQRIKSAIKDCEYGIYVTKDYLQKKYPIKGKTCGASDAVIKELDDRVLEKRIEKINKINCNVNIGLVGFYHDSNKGIDTAIKALSNINLSKECILHILGNGSEKDREYWYSFANKCGLPKSSLMFPEPIIGIEHMFCWYDTMDIIILPSRSEGLPRTIVEAMSRACPCITSNVCGLSELIENRWTHNPGDSKQLTKLIIKMINNPNEMIRSSIMNFERSRDYREEIQTGKRINFLKDYRAHCEGIK